MAFAWALRDERVTSALIGASSVSQLEDNVAALDRLDFTDDELAEIDRHATDSAINLWAGRATRERRRDARRVAERCSLKGGSHDAVWQCLAAQGR